MKAEFKELWLKALRSGDFTQGTGTLRRDLPEGSRYCCLGVLCVAAGGIPVNINSVGILVAYEFEDFRTGSGSLSSNGDEYFGLTNDEEDILITMNDTDKKSFAEIADWIEENL